MFTLIARPRLQMVHPNVLKSRRIVRDRHALSLPLSFRAAAAMSGAEFFHRGTIARRRCPAAAAERVGHQWRHVGVVVADKFRLRAPRSTVLIVVDTPVDVFFQETSERAGVIDCTATSAAGPQWSSAQLVGDGQGLRRVRSRRLPRPERSVGFS